MEGAGPRGMRGGPKAGTSILGAFSGLSSPLIACSSSPSNRASSTSRSFRRSAKLVRIARFSCFAAGVYLPLVICPDASDPYFELSWSDRAAEAASEEPLGPVESRYAALQRCPEHG